MKKASWENIMRVENEGGRICFLPESGELKSFEKCPEKWIDVTALMEQKGEKFLSGLVIEEYLDDVVYPSLGYEEKDIAEREPDAQAEEKFKREPDNIKRTSKRDEGQIGFFD